MVDGSRKDKKKKSVHHLVQVFQDTDKTTTTTTTTATLSMLGSGKMSAGISTKWEILCMTWDVRMELQLSTAFKLSSSSAKFLLPKIEAEKKIERHPSYLFSNLCPRARRANKSRMRRSSFGALLLMQSRTSNVKINSPPSGACVFRLKLGGRRGKMVNTKS